MYCDNKLCVVLCCVIPISLEVNVYLFIPDSV